jgi:hypothetical protein
MDQGQRAVLAALLKLLGQAGKLGWGLLVAVQVVEEGIWEAVRKGLEGAAPTKHSKPYKS